MTGMEHAIEQTVDEQVAFIEAWLTECHSDAIDVPDFMAMLRTVVAAARAESPAPAPAPRVVVTAAELDALPVDTVVVDQSGIPRMKRYPSSHMPGGWTHGGRDPLSARMLADGRPMTVAWLPVDRAEGDGRADV